MVLCKPWPWNQGRSGNLEILVLLLLFQNISYILIVWSKKTSQISSQKNTSQIKIITTCTCNHLCNLDQLNTHPMWDSTHAHTTLISDPVRI